MQSNSTIAISAVIITLNEADNIERCLHSLQNVVDEVIVLDAFSEDKTIDICKRLGAKVWQKKWEGYSKSKNFANTLAQNDWILSIDADEVLSEKLQQSIKTLQPKDDTVYSMNRLTDFAGQWVMHSGWFPEWKVRLFNRQTVHWEGDFVHETLAIPDEFASIKLNGLLHHYSYKSDEDHWQRIEKYAQLAAAAMHQKGKKATFIKLWIAPMARFIRTFFLKKGFLDGKVGWKISCRDMYLVHRKYQILKSLNLE